MDADIGRGESPNVDTRRVVAIVAGVLIFVALVSFGFQALFGGRVGQTYTVHHPFPAPAVIASERAQRLSLEAKQRRDLNGAHGRMPIAAAMKAIAAEGTSAFDPVGGAP